MANTSRSANKGFYTILILVGVVGAGALIFALQRGGGATTEAVDLGDIEDRDLIELAQGVTYGDTAAPITIMEFGDYQCPACKSFATTVKVQLDLAYIESGEAKLVYHDFPLTAIHQHAFLAARAARCAGDQGGRDSYFEYHDALFRTQADWAGMSNANGHFKDLAKELELDRSVFNGCLDSDRHADVVTANQQLGTLLGVGGTPTILVHHRGSGPAIHLGGFQFVDIQQAIEAGS